MRFSTWWYSSCPEAVVERGVSFSLSAQSLLPWGSCWERSTSPLPLSISFFAPSLQAPLHSPYRFSLHLFTPAPSSLVRCLSFHFVLIPAKYTPTRKKKLRWGTGRRHEGRWRTRGGGWSGLSSSSWCLIIISTAEIFFVSGEERKQWERIYSGGRISALLGGREGASALLPLKQRERRGWERVGH